MAKLGTVAFTGASDNAYDFTVYTADTEFNRAAAVYAVTRRYEKPDRGYSHTVIYIGQSENIPERFGNHHQDACFRRHKANAVCLHGDKDEDSRREKEADLIEAYEPACNG